VEETSVLVVGAQLCGMVMVFIGSFGLLVWTWKKSKKELGWHLLKYGTLFLLGLFLSFLNEALSLFDELFDVFGTPGVIATVVMLAVVLFLGYHKYRLEQSTESKK